MGVYFRAQDLKAAGKGALFYIGSASPEDVHGAGRGPLRLTTGMDVRLKKPLVVQEAQCRTKTGSFSVFNFYLPMQEFAKAAKKGAFD